MRSHCGDASTARQSGCNGSQRSRPSNDEQIQKGHADEHPSFRRVRNNRESAVAWTPEQSAADSSISTPAHDYSRLGATGTTRLVATTAAQTTETVHGLADDTAGT
jgi:hypothetical protein